MATIRAGVGCRRKLTVQELLQEHHLKVLPQLSRLVYDDALVYFIKSSGEKKYVGYHACIEDFICYSAKARN